MQDDSTISKPKNDPKASDSTMVYMAAEELEAQFGRHFSDKYANDRRKLVDAEIEQAWDVPKQSTEQENRVARIVTAIREYERNVIFGNKVSEDILGPDILDMGGQFLTNKKCIEQRSLLYTISRHVPKGALLHLHFNAELNPERLLQEARKTTNMYVEVTAGGTSPPDNTTLSIQDTKDLSLSDRKRLADLDLYPWACRSEAPGHTERYVPVSANGIRLEAFPDTGSELDIISHSLSTQLNLKLNKAQARTIQTPTGRKIQTLGTAELNIAFQGENSKCRQTFHVLARSVHGMILGKSFLAKTQALTKFAHRIKSRFVDLASRIPRLHLLGSVTERVVGSINGVPTTAVDDTGSDVMLISWKEAERLGLQITTDHSHRTLLEFVDGEEVYTDGAVLDVDWRFGHNTTGDAIKVNLQVVRNLTCNLILSNEVLFLTNTYSNPDFFLAEETEIPLHENYASLCVITDRTQRKRMLDYLVGWFRSQPAETDVEDSELIANAERVLDEEVARQLYEEERINRLPQNERSCAWAEEYELRRQLERRHAALSSSPSALQPSGQPSATSSASGGPPSRSSAGNRAPLQTLNRQTGWRRYFWNTQIKRAGEGSRAIVVATRTNYI